MASLAPSNQDPALPLPLVDANVEALLKEPMVPDTKCVIWNRASKHHGQIIRYDEAFPHDSTITDKSNTVPPRCYGINPSARSYLLLN